jgi:DNA-binding MarR family transcriptional regulator
MAARLEQHPMKRHGRNGTTERPIVLEDHVDRLTREWAAERPDLDVTPITLVYRLTRIASAWNIEIDKVFADAGITSTDFAVLANLRRSGEPFQLTQRQIMSVLRLTSGTISLRIDKLVDRGMVKRQPDPSDARAALVTLTEAGRHMFDAVAPEHLANEARLVAALSLHEQKVVADLLRIMLVEIEQPATARPDHRIGMTVAPAYVGQKRRAAVGLPSAPGILVEAVHSGGPAARAGIQPGDFLTASLDVPLRSLTCLERASDSHPDRLPLSIQRNGQPIEVTVTSNA